MKPDQRKLNEFLVDLAEFLGKHFLLKVNRTRIVEEDGCAGLLFKYEPCGSVLEVDSSGAEVAFRFGEARWRLGEWAGINDLYHKTLGEMIAVFDGRRLLVTGYRDGHPAVHQVHRGGDERQAVAELQARHPGCSRITLKQWETPERAVV